MNHLIVPQELADALIAEGYARKRPPTRGTLTEWVIDQSGTATVCITLLQAPMVIEFYADWFRRKAASRRDQKLTVSISGPRGKIDLLDVRGDEDLGALVTRVRSFLEE